MKTIPEIAKMFNVSPQAIHKAKKKAEKTLGYELQGITSSNDRRKILYSDEQIQIIRNHLSIVKVDEIDLIEGNHNVNVQLANIPQSFNLESFRTNSNRLDLALNPNEYLESLEIALNTVEKFMNDAETVQQQRLQQIQETNISAKRRLNQFKERKLEHSLKTEIYAQIQNNSILEFQSTANEINGLGVGKL